MSAAVESTPTPSIRERVLASGNSASRLHSRLERAPTVGVTPMQSSMSLGSPDGKGKEATKAKKKLPMFKGVFVPTCENMWGVIIFLRFYKIVGYASSRARLASRHFSPCYPSSCALVSGTPGSASRS